VLYSFITTPIHWWHHHQQNDAGIALSVSSENEDASFSQNTGTSYTSYCNICSHSYSAYTEAQAYQYILPNLSHHSPAGGYIEHAFTIPVLLFSNKGPPTLLS
jgi:hypothetical protein